MSRTVQFNIRTAPTVAASVRARARERGIPLGEALAELVEAGRAWSGDGIVLRPDPALQRALDALAAVEGRSPEEILEHALRGDVRRQLIRLADGVAEAPEPAAPEPTQSADPEPVSEPDEREVGLFTVFD